MIVKNFGVFMVKTIVAIAVLVLAEITLPQSASASISAWNPETAETNIRKFFGIVIFLITAVRVSKLYNDGKTGASIGQGLLGAFLGLFIFDSSILKSLMGFFKSLLGF